MDTEKDTVQFSSQISEKIWGHRFRAGQRGPEYTLEFLNIMAGTKYQFGQSYYERKRMEEFRKFVFEGAKEGAPKKDGTISHVTFEDEYKKEIQNHLGIDHSQLDDLQMFFKNLAIQMTTPTGKMLDRSWYATMLFPLHESLLFFELRQDKTKDKASFERNFFARGGELYYLMITFGTQEDLELRRSIEQRLREIMQQNESITGVVDKIREKIDEEYGANIENKKPRNPAVLIKDPSLSDIFNNYEKREYPYLPDHHLKLYSDFAKELDSLLKLKIDLYELFGLLTSLICFQLHRYMIYQAEKTNSQKNYYFIDCLDGHDPHIKRLAQDAFSRHETSIQKRFDSFTDLDIEQLLPEDKAIEMLKRWKEDARNSTADKDEKRYEKFFEDIKYTSVRDVKKKALIKVIETPDEQQAIKMLKLKIKEFSRDELKTKQLPITRTLARDGGFIALGVGVRGRYVLSDNFLCSLVYATLGDRKQMDFHEFMQELFDHSNIVIGTEEAKSSGIYEREGVNLRYFQHNENKLRQKLKQNGLLQEYSDATALITNPYKVGGDY
ncbi:hypothetical protein RG959_00825 [Domibacillus sp. 8LH]|uniref:hypothetical protein n=1 Tax=Domibacillus sp. 8LH TaxID=3073900 RepID=UPI00317B2945